MKQYYIYTYGCQMNVHESEKIAGFLEARGYKLTQSVENADVVVFNTCCIRESAEQKIMGNIGAMKPLKKKNKDLIVAICGCMSQQKNMSNTIKSKFPFVDIIFGANNIEYFGDFLDEFNENKKYLERVVEGDYIESANPINYVRDNNLYAYVNIMYGCNNFCTYCIVPYVRGREISRSPESIYAEVKDLIKSGYKVITLLGQNVNSYGNDGKFNITFPELLKTIASFEGDFELRFMTSHPKDISDELISVMAKSPKISKTLHLPAQSGSNDILKSMNRNYTIEKYLASIEKVKKAIPDIALSTDIIVGFPGESEDDYLKTVELIKKVRYHNAFVFMYSKRKGTIAEKLENQIPIGVKHERINNLLAIQHTISNEIFMDYVGKTIRVLVESKTDSAFIAKAQCGKVVRIQTDLDILNKFVDVKIEEYKSGDLIGKLV